jgi:hypothetical protein
MTMPYIVENAGARVEGGPHGKLAKAKREAVRYFRLLERARHDGFTRSEVGWRVMRNGTHSLWADDGYVAIHTGIVVRETD